MSVLEKFFQVSLLLTVIILGVNIFLTAFGPSMTGDDLFETGESYLSGGAASTSGNVVEQQTSDITVPEPETSDWDNVWQQFLSLAIGFQLVVLKIFTEIGTPMFAIALAGIVTIFQAAGGAYIVWAIISAWKGGGSP